MMMMMMMMMTMRRKKGMYDCVNVSTNRHCCAFVPTGSSLAASTTQFCFSKHTLHHRIPGHTAGLQSRNILLTIRDT